jgi:hypothetical protein
MDNEKTKGFLEKELKKHKSLINNKSNEKDLVGFQVLNKIINK